MVGESDIEKYLIKRVKELGGDTRKVRWLGRDSAPDRIVFLPAGHLIFIELKAPGKAATFPVDAHERKQHREHVRLRKFGAHVLVLDSLEQIDELLR